MKETTDMKTASTALPRAALALAAVLAAGAAQAADPPTWDQYSWDVPLLFGDYIAVPGGQSTTLGSLTISRTPDARGITGGAIYFYDPAGKLVTQGVNGTITYSDDLALAQGAPLATTPLTAYAFSNGPVRGGPAKDPVVTPTGDQITWEWTGPRAGTLTVNGVTQKMVHAWSGPPLVEATDYSGTWLLVGRTQLAPSLDEPSRIIPRTFGVRLTRVTEARNYVGRPDLAPGQEPWGDYGLPPADAVLYDIRCESFNCWPEDLRTFGPGDAFTLWLDPSGKGRVLSATREGDAWVVLDIGLEQSRAYAEADRILGRRLPAVGTSWVIIYEFALLRLGPDTLPVWWDLPACEVREGVRIPEANCNNERRH